MFNLEVNLKAEDLSLMLDSLCDFPEKFSFATENGKITLNITCNNKNERNLIRAKTQEDLRKRFNFKIRKYYNKKIIKKLSK